MTTAKLEMVEASGSGPLVGDDGMIQDRRQAVNKPVPASRVAQKPVPQQATQDPREFQLGQIRRRFNPKESKLARNELSSIEEGTALLQFKITPSDPDFPFEMSALEVSLSVPPQYPKQRPSLGVLNKDIPRGFAFNIESGFSGLVSEKQDATLLELMKALDKNLEVFLSVPKAETVKLVPNKDTRHLAVLPSSSVGEATGFGREDVASSNHHEAQFPPKLEQHFTLEQKGEAAKRREVETRQLEARMGRLPLYKKSGDGIAYTIPIEPKKRAELPIALQAVKAVQLFVPLLYPLQPCRVQLEGVDSKESKPVEKGFEQKGLERQEVTLMVHVNYLAQNMHALAKTVVELEKKSMSDRAKSTPPSEKGTGKGKQIEGHQDAERSHIQYITRPPEWTIIDPDDVSGTDSDDLYSYDTGDESSDIEGGVQVESGDTQEPSQLATHNQERGTAISFPFIELYGIELLEVTTLNLTVKCERCKEVMEVRGLKNGVSKTECCKKCASPLGITFRRDLVHAHAVRAGFLDLEGCIVGDMLPRFVFALEHNNLANYQQHIHTNLLTMLHPLPVLRNSLHPGRNNFQHLPGMPPKIHLPHPASKVPAHHHFAPPSRNSTSPKERDPRSSTRHRAPQTRPLSSLLEILPLVPLQLLSKGLCLRQVP